MRQLSHLSHTKLVKWAADRDAFYLRYLANERQEKPPQCRPLAVGAAFDIFLKCRLAGDLRIEVDGDDFDRQVEPHNREFARDAGRRILRAYMASGAYRRLLTFLEKCETVALETKRTGTIGGVPFVGYPDLSARCDGSTYVEDFKVRGYCGKSTTSPTKGYLYCVDGPGWPAPSRSHKTTHKLVVKRYDNNGVEHSCTPLNDCSETYAAQLSLYAWLLGEPPGSHFSAGIRECVAKPGPLLRFAEYRAQVSTVFQLDLLARAQHAWDCIQSKHIFDYMPRSESDARCAVLDAVAAQPRTRETTLMENQHYVSA